MQVKRELKKSLMPHMPWSANVVSFLNADKPTTHGARLTKASRRRISELINLFAAAMKAIEQEPSEDLVNDSSAELNALEVELNERIQHYPTVPAFYFDWGREWCIDEVRFSDKPSQDAGEWVAARGVIELAKLRMLANVRRCICGRWFFATRVDQRSCSSKCRHKNYEQTSDFKAKRREYMRSYNELKKTGKVK